MAKKAGFFLVAAIVLLAAFFIGNRQEPTILDVEGTYTSTTLTEATTELTTGELVHTTEESTWVTTTLSEPQTLTQEATTTTAVPVTEMATEGITEATTEVTTLAPVYITVDYKTLLGRYSIADENGGMVYEGSATWYDGQTAFDLLRDELRKAGIPMEFSRTPVYNSIYIEGIDNVYEFDFGELSGWMYMVNGNFPGYASSEYILSPGDRVEFRYTLDMGKDIGDNYTVTR